MVPMLGSGFMPPLPETGTGAAHPIERQLVSIGTSAMSDNLYRLLERHQRLDDRLRRLQSSRWVDPFEIARLKKLKLALKDRLAGFVKRRALTRSGT